MSVRWPTPINGCQARTPFGPCDNQCACNPNNINIGIDSPVVKIKWHGVFCWYYQLEEEPEEYCTYEPSCVKIEGTSLVCPETVEDPANVITVPWSELPYFYNKVKVYLKDLKSPLSGANGTHELTWDGSSSWTWTDSTVTITLYSYASTWALNVSLNANPNTCYVLFLRALTGGFADGLYGQYCDPNCGAQASYDTCVETDCPNMCRTYPDPWPQAWVIPNWNHCFLRCCSDVDDTDVLPDAIVISPARFVDLFPSDPLDPLTATSALCIEYLGCHYCGHSYVVNPVNFEDTVGDINAVTETACVDCDDSECEGCNDAP